MTRQQIEWAKTHDWYSSDYDGTVWVKEYPCVTPFTDYQALRHWAGY